MSELYEKASPRPWSSVEQDRDSWLLTADGLNPFDAGDCSEHRDNARFAKYAVNNIERLEAQIVSLRAAVRGLLPHVFTWQTGDPSEYPMLVEFWESEQKLGRGEAAAVLAAYATLSSTGEG